MVGACRLLQSNPLPLLPSTSCCSVPRRALHVSGRPAKLDDSHVPPSKVRDYLRTWLLNSTTDSVIQNGTENSISAAEIHSDRIQNLGDHFSPEGGDDVANEIEEARVTDQDGVPDEAIDNRLFFRRGDLVELAKITFDGGTELAFFIREDKYGAEFFTEQGTWVHLPTVLVRFTVPRYVDSAVLDPIMSLLPTAFDPLDPKQESQVSLPGEAAGPIQQLLVTFRGLSQEVYRAHANSLDHAHAILADDVLHRSYTLPEMAMRIFGRSAPAEGFAAYELFAVQSAVWRDELGFRHDLNYHDKNTAPIEIRPLRETRIIEEVRSWVRMDQDDMDSRDAAIFGNQSEMERKVQRTNPLHSFLGKVKRVIAQSREIRPITLDGHLGPSFSKPPGDGPALVRTPTCVTFNANDLKVIQLFDAWTDIRSFPPGAMINAIPPMILKATGMYDGKRLDAATGHTFLQEIGIHPPWANRVRTLLNLVWDADGRHDLDASETVLTAFQEDHSNDQLELGERDGADSARFESLRKDWGKLDVYCIDQAGTTDVDDGISLERIPGSDSTFWLHVHIANPTATLGPQDRSIRKAERTVRSVYLPEETLHMLPRESVIAHSLKAGCRTLTFSTKLNDQGQIIDSNITPGLVHQVHHITPEDIDRITGTESGEGMSWQVGVERSAHTKSEVSDVSRLSETQLEDLRSLHSIARARRQLRLDNGAILFDKPVSKVVVIDQDPVSSNGLLAGMDSASNHHTGDPLIRLTAQPFDSDQSHDPPSAGGQMMVAEMMIVTCEAAARWCADRSLPMPYRGTVGNPEQASLGSPFVVAGSHEHEQDSSTPNFITGLERARLLGRATEQSQPIPHRTVGVSMYTRVTSPLRRFGDMVAHWQIQAALLYEARTGRSLLSHPTELSLAFTRAQIDEMIPRMLANGAIVARTEANSRTFWTTQLLVRAWKFGEAALSDTFECYITREESNPKFLRGWLLAMNIDVRVALPEEEKGAMKEIYQVGDLVEVRIESVSTFNRRIVVEPLRRIRQSAG